MTLRSLQSPVLSVDDLEDWERLLVPAEAHHARRVEEARTIAGYRSIAATLGVSFEQWTALDLDRAYALAEAHEAGVLADIVDMPGVEPRWGVPANTAAFDGIGRREVVALAKAEAAELGLDLPKSYADVVADVVLFAATWAAVKRAPNTNHNTESEST